MKKILIASVADSFPDDDHARLEGELKSKLREYGFQVDGLQIPFSFSFPEMMPQILGLRLHHLEDSGDRLICLRTPSYILSHPHKLVWFSHHYREAYNLWGTPFGPRPQDGPAPAIRENIMRADEAALAEARKIYAASRLAAARLKEYNGLDSEPLYQPVAKPEKFICREYGGFIYGHSRLTPRNRPELAISAMRRTKTPVKLMLSGAAEQPGYADHLRKLIRQYDLEAKITLSDAAPAEEEKIRCLSGCLAALYPPFDESGWSPFPLEAQHSGKAVIACTDSGGVSELIEDGRNGWLAAPEPEALAEKFDALYEDKNLAEKAGQAASGRPRELAIGWDQVIERLAG